MVRMLQTNKPQKQEGESLKQNFFVNLKINNKNKKTRNRRFFSAIRFFFK